MKNKVLFFALIGMMLCTVGVTVTSCADIPSADFDRQILTVSHRDLSTFQVGIAGGERIVPVRVVNIPDGAWTATSNADWVTIARHADRVVITAAPSSHYFERMALVTIAYGQQIYRINVVQAGRATSLAIVGFPTDWDGIVNVPVAGAQVPITVATNMNINKEDVTIFHPWATVYSIEPAATPGYTVITFDVAMTFETSMRQSLVRIQSSDNFRAAAEFTFEQDLFDVSEIVAGLEEGNIITLPGAGGSATVTVSSSLELDDVTTSLPWVTVASITPVDAQTAIVTLDVAPSVAILHRINRINLHFGENSAFFEIVQNSAFVPVPLRLDMLHANATHYGDGGNLPALITGRNEANTGYSHYHTRWSAPDTPYRATPHFVQINLDEPLSTIGFTLVPRDNSLGNPGTPIRYGVWVSATGETGMNDDGEWAGNWVRYAVDTFTREGNPQVDGQNQVVGNLITFSTPQQFIRFIPETRWGLAQGTQQLDPSGGGGWWAVRRMQVWTLD